MGGVYTFTVNGKNVSTDENKSMLRFLRDDLKLYSVKDGCSEGACGACTILADGKTVRACVLKTSKAAGKNILTVEGLSVEEKEAFVYAFGAKGAVQCGFCIPGMVMSAKALLDQNPDPSDDEISTALKEALLAVKPFYDAHPGRAGIACAMKNSGVGVGLVDDGNAILRVENGILVIYTCASDIGQGGYTVFCQDAAQATGLSKSHIRMGISNTENAPDSGTTSGSRQTLVTGEAVRGAAFLVRDAMCAAQMAVEITTIPAAPAIAGAYYAFDGKLRSTLPMEHTYYRP